MTNYIALIITICAVCASIIGAASYISDVSRINNIQQKAMNQDMTNATKETQQFIVDKTNDAANEIAIGAIISMFLMITGAIVTAVLGIIAFFSKFF